MFVITACPYSGTKYTVSLLRRIGLNVGHEKLYDDGAVSWVHAHLTKADLTAQGLPKNLVMLHQIRHPLMVISTLSRLHGGYKYHGGSQVVEMLNERLAYVGCKHKVTAAERKYVGIKGGMVLWYYLNRHCIKKSDGWYTIETLDHKWGWFLEQIGQPQHPMPQISKKINRHAHRHIYSWNDIYKVDADLALKILTLARKFGYKQIPEAYMDDPYYIFPERIELE